MGILDRLLGRKQKQPVAALALNASRAGFMDACVRAWADLEPSKPLEEIENDLRDLARFTNAVTGAPRQHGSPAAKPAGGLAEIHLLAHSLMGTTDKETQLRLMQELTAYFENMTDEELASYWDDTLQLIEPVSDDPSLMLITVFAPHLLSPSIISRERFCAVCDTRGDPFELFFCSDCQKREGRVIERLLRERDEAVHDLLSRNLGHELRDADDGDSEEAPGSDLIKRSSKLRELLQECGDDPEEVIRRLNAAGRP